MRRELGRDLRRRPEHTADLGRAGPVQTEQRAELAADPLAAPAGVLVAQQADAVEAGRHVLEGGDPVGQPVVEIARREPPRQAVEALEPEGAMQGAELVVPDVLHVAPREGVLSVPLQEGEVLPVQGGGVGQRPAQGDQDIRIGEQAGNEVEPRDVAVVLRQIAPRPRRAAAAQRHDLPEMAEHEVPALGLGVVARPERDPLGPVFLGPEGPPDDLLEGFRAVVADLDAVLVGPLARGRLLAEPAAEPRPQERGEHEGHVAVEMGRQLGRRVQRGEQDGRARARQRGDEDRRPHLDPAEILPEQAVFDLGGRELNVGEREGDLVDQPVEPGVVAQRGHRRRLAQYPAQIATVATAITSHRSMKSRVAAMGASPVQSHSAIGTKAAASASRLRRIRIADSVRSLSAAAWTACSRARSSRSGARTVAAAPRAMVIASPATCMIPASQKTTRKRPIDDAAMMERTTI